MKKQFLMARLCHDLNRFIAVVSLKPEDELRREALLYVIQNFI